MILFRALAVELDRLESGSLGTLTGLMGETHDVKSQRIPFVSEGFGECDGLLVFSCGELLQRFPGWCGGSRLADFLHRGVGIQHDGIIGAGFEGDGSLCGDDGNKGEREEGECFHGVFFSLPVSERKP